MIFAPDGNTDRILVFVVAYHAERHLRSVFERIPQELFEDDRVHFLCIDDASGDEGPVILRDWVQEHGISNVTILRNPVNQGYGGNQKLGYRIAIDAGFDFVILLHGDGQYAPEMLPEFIKARRDQGADVVLGSRMKEAKGARQGGMPFYKRIGNRVLTGFQNRFTKLGLSEYHTGYRGYSTSFLQRVPFERNTNDFHFDTEILLQAAHVNAKIAEFAVPTHYGDEICHVSGLRYAKNVVLATIQYRMHKMGMLCSLKYRDLAPTRYQDKTHVLYSSHKMALTCVESENPGKVLDIGCGPGFVGRECEKMGAEVTGLDAYEPLPEMITHFHRVDLENEELPVDPLEYDVVLLLDVIEHLKEPEEFLLAMRHRGDVADTRGVAPLLILSTPNIAFAAVRLNLLVGRFNYAERGILDITHKRLFTLGTLKNTLQECGYSIQRVRYIGVPFQIVMDSWMGRFLGLISSGLARIWPRMFAFQFLIECRPLPGVRQVLRQAESIILAESLQSLPGKELE